MKICKGKIVGFNRYEKNGVKKVYAQVVYKSAVSGFEGERVVSTFCDGNYKIGDTVRIADDFRYPSIIEE